MMIFNLKYNDDFNFSSSYYCLEFSTFEQLMECSPHLFLRRAGIQTTSLLQSDIQKV